MNTEKNISQRMLCQSSVLKRCTCRWLTVEDPGAEVQPARSSTLELSMDQRDMIEMRKHIIAQTPSPLFRGLNQTFNQKLMIKAVISLSTLGHQRTVQPVAIN